MIASVIVVNTISQIPRPVQNDCVHLHGVQTAPRRCGAERWSVVVLSRSKPGKTTGGLQDVSKGITGHWLIRELPNSATASDQSASRPELPLPSKRESSRMVVSLVGLSNLAISAAQCRTGK